MHKLCVGLSLASVVCAIFSNQALAEQCIIKDGQPNAKIVVAENSPRMVSFAALELQYYLEKMSGAKVPIVFEPTDDKQVKIYVGASKYTDKLGIDDEGLKYGAYRMASGPDYLVLLGHDFDYHPPKPYAIKRNEIEQALEIWDKKTEKYTDLKWGSPIGGTSFKKWWNPNRSAVHFNEFMEERYGRENRKVWNPNNREWEWGLDYCEGLENGYTPGFWMQDEGGTLNAVYAFLRDLGARWYMPSEIGEVIPEIKTIALPDVNKTDKPDFAVRYWFWYSALQTPFEQIMWARRLGMGGYYEAFGDIGHAHGLANIHSRKEMQEKHPEYYALDKSNIRNTDYRGTGHVCFSSEGFFEETVNYARFMYDEYDAPHISLFPQDGFRHCQCESCKKLSSSDLVWGFVDKVARDLYKTHPDRIVSCTAYTPYINPPLNVEKFTPNVVVVIGKSMRVLMDDPVRWRTYTSKVEGWKEKISSGMIMRGENNLYHKNQIDYPVIHPRNMAKDLKYLKETGIGESSEVSQTGGHWAAPGCDHLNLYVQARFLWDADQDIEKMLAEYYEIFYGPAAKEMKTAFDFAEAKYSRTDKSGNRNRCNPQNVPLSDRVKLLELLHKARNVAGDKVYGKRIDVIISELPDIEML
ncbi:MAG: DUF4838 domain-containing protein, partial [Lentisphaerae bacterium]|nr:DUF4838 domain-containing protein [Lentisphaerota bacterium]